jgi:hypothetical protein
MDKIDLELEELILVEHEKVEPAAVRLVKEYQILGYKIDQILSRIRERKGDLN